MCPRFSRLLLLLDRLRRTSSLRELCRHSQPEYGLHLPSLPCWRQLELISNELLWKGAGCCKAAEGQMAELSQPKATERKRCLPVSLPLLLFPRSMPLSAFQVLVSISRGRIIFVPCLSLNCSSAHSVLHECDQALVQGMFEHRDCAGASHITSWASLG